MLNKVVSWLGRLTRGFFYALRFWLRQWPWFLAAAVLSMLLAALLWLRLPDLWSSEGALMVRPLIEREGHLLAVDELGDHYVVRMKSDESAKNLYVALDGQIDEQHIMDALTFSNDGGGIIRVQSRHADPLLAERLTAALLRNFEATLNAENRQRIDLDRVVVQRTAVTLPARVGPTLGAWLGRGVLLGLLGAAVALLARDRYQRRRVATALVAEQLLKAPTLGTIPLKR